MPDWKLELRTRLAHLRIEPGRETAIIEELSQHLDDRYEDLLMSGIPEPDARQKILEELKDSELLAAALPRAERRYGEYAVPPTSSSFGDRLVSLLQTLRQDLIYTLRRLSRSPGLVLAVVLSIGIGIATNATIFSIVSRFVLRPAPVADPGTLMALYTLHDGEECCNNFSMPTYVDVRDQAKSFSGVAANDELVPASIGGKGEPERAWGQATTANYFDVVRAGMTLGRGFLPSEEHQPVIVLGHRLWQRRFASDPNIIGKPITLSGHPYTVVGVAPPGFRGLDIVLDPVFWVPLGNVAQLAPTGNIGQVNTEIDRGNHWLAVIARLKPGVTASQAAAELHTLAGHYATAYPKTDKGGGFVLSQAGSVRPGQTRSMILMFLAILSVAVLLVLCIACANVANLLLAKGMARQREMAIRLALGAARTKLLRQMLMESVLMALGGGLVGILLALWATGALSAFRVPAPVPLDMSIAVDWRVLFYTFGLSAVTGLFLGLVPAWIASRPVLISALRGEDAMARPGRRANLRSILVVAQIAMSLVLLCGTGLLLRSLQNASSIDIGFRSRGLLMMSVDPRVHGYTPERTTQFLTQLRERVVGLPGVVSAAATDAVPLAGGNRSDGFSLVGGKPEQNVPIVDLFMASPGYFETLGIPRVIGRDFEQELATGQKVGIVNQAFVQQLFHGENPLGRHVNGAGVDYQIIGVVGNIKSRTIGEETRPVLFRSLAQSTASDPSFLGYQLVVRYDGDSAAVASQVRSQIHALDPAMAVYNAETIEEHLRSALFLPRLGGTLFGVFGITGLLLAAIGLYGIMSYSVTRRTREIGIRIALGAQLGAVQRLIVRQGMLLTAIAVGLGLPAALVGAKFSSTFLYGVRPHDLVTFLTVPFLLLVIALLACWIPARRASRVDPQTALRYE
jgi:predicted permease